jgi:CheY-like chemotaxis protein
MGILCIVDDNELDLRIMKLNLIKYPVFKHVLYFYGGLQLIKYLEDNKTDGSNLPDIIFLDLNMPQFNGWNVLDALETLYSSLCKQVAVYVVSASIIPKDINRALSYDFVKDFIAKPVTKDTFLSVSKEVRHDNYR